MMVALLPPIAAFIITVALGFLMIVAAASVAGALARGGRRERAVDAYEALAVSRFTIPVSIIVPVDRDSASLSPLIDSLLGLNYPELEVILVAGSTSEKTIEALKADWSLEPKELFYRRTLETAPVVRIFGSERDERFVLVEKQDGGRADALNCGVSLARFRYVVSISPDVVFDRDALLRLMAPALRDPATVLAVTSYVERKPAGSIQPAPQPDPSSSDEMEWTRAADDYQRLASIRTWMASRLAWHQLRCGLPPREGVAAWRRDAILELGGFSIAAADAELDLLVRLQTSGAKLAAGRVVRTSEVFGHADTMKVSGAAQLVSRRQRAVLEALRTFRKTPGTHPARGTMMFVLAVELMTPAAQAVLVVLIAAATLFGATGISSPGLLLLLLTFGYGLVSASALLLRGGTPGAPSGADLKRLLIRAPLELAVYRPALVWSRLTSRT
jgi:cellulose synthase/poly-beta-1,6-N-acetylglucosamine synthase-like glycosyltransferase